MRTLNFKPASIAHVRGGRLASFRRFPAALTAFLMALMISTAAAAGPDQFASLEVRSFGSSSENFDLRALETKIRNTEALDLFSKINIKIEISSLIEEIARSREDRSAAGLVGLKARFEKLIGNTVAMLRKGDRPLADEVDGSRAALWQFLNTAEVRIADASLDNGGQND